MAEPVLENNEIKQRAIRRLIVAVVLVLMAVGILTYLSYYKPAKVVTKPAAATLPPPPPPIVTGPEPQAVEPAQVAQALPDPPPADTPSSPSTPITPPPPSVNTKALPSPGPGPKKAAPDLPKPLLNSEPQTPTQPKAPNTQVPPPTAVATKPAPLSVPSGYVVQFGVFSNPQNAQQLVERLKQIGIAAHTETRVQLPAFKSKAEADAALAKMKEKGISATLLAR